MASPGRNEPCPCGSGRKHKHCCLRGQASDELRSASGAAHGAVEIALDWLRKHHRLSVEVALEHFFGFIPEGAADHSAREGFPAFVADRLEAVKWRNWKVVFYDEQRDWWSPPVKLGSPKAFDLLTDPKEEYPATALRNTWNAGPVMKIAAELEQSLKKFPPIAPGTPDPYTPPKPKTAGK